MNSDEKSLEIIPEKIFSLSSISNILTGATIKEFNQIFSNDFLEQETESSNYNENLENYENQTKKEIQEMKENKQYENTKEIAYSEKKLNIINVINIEEEKAIVEKLSSQHVLYRLDYAIKHFKTTISNFIVSYINKLIVKTKFNIQIKKISVPSYKLFTGKYKLSENKKFLNCKIKDILTLGAENENNKIQKKNKKVIEIIENKSPNEYRNKENYLKLIQFFNMSFENCCHIFYYEEENEKEYKKYYKNEKTIFLDHYLKEEKKIRLREQGGFINLVKNYK